MNSYRVVPVAIALFKQAKTLDVRKKSELPAKICIVCQRPFARRRVRPGAIRTELRRSDRGSSA
ncbi:MAG: hypothetical protein CML03_13550 [Pseudooceanicola sp.]|nr:hypothetical protein [Pseudooceanicola sp.]